ncbi:molybdenum cofactor guanylyltransferase [Pelotomaculum terephthalicicum JT]|uniref:molybdenum cofactor guanylyltransferase n=1 Tax=Pelotomaculum TaxID=191373 RepID=UPI0009C78D5B|nr:MULTISPECIES: molybdenum cofactor guanylyltransferase [Pelotomaculum]MCG9969662.1 molybdenum cofactor guanylyltransferase [Pelotomaculum terephthalicicum JT]OPX92184.1 MAG: Molybdenum cofactor guanylyltransferase [Pelotomaculum sp. PtaB.Bin117]OPY62431.1 MAG: Molybdenum cofactor guanylyltransferase [Pelotomaculum sp. PtaU1.Bin065]
MIQATGVILAGGKSVRMGTDKAFLKVGRQGMLEHIAGEFKKVFSEVLISGGSMETGRNLGLRVVADLIKGNVPLCGIHAALHAALHEKILVVACDMPFITAELAGFMIRQLEGYDVAVPSYGIYRQPLFAAYSRSCLSAIEKSLSADRYKTDDFYSLVKVNYVSMESLCPDIDIKTVYFNVNTPADLHKAREMADKDGER